MQRADEGQVVGREVRGGVQGRVCGGREGRDPIGSQGREGEALGEGLSVSIHGVQLDLEACEKCGVNESFSTLK